MSAAPILSVEHLTMRFGGLVAIDRLSFQAARGHITAVASSSGDEAWAPPAWIGAGRGAILVRRTIGFEEATDRLLPRSDRFDVSFHSITRPFADGLVLSYPSKWTLANAQAGTGWGIDATLWVARRTAELPAATMGVPALTGWGLAVLSLGLLWLALLSTALRWIGKMTEAGLFARQPDSSRSPPMAPRKRRSK